jgi:basic membrane lipoprotein Med (substrate-binding protein (PBP1-ABC) superfamily)
MRNHRHVIALLLVVMAVFGLVPGLVAAQDSLIESVCLVTDLGRVNDGTFNQFAHEGAVAATDEFQLDYTYIETQNQADYAVNIQTCLDDSYDVVVTVGFLIADATRAAAADNPDTYFIGVDQFVGADADGNPAPANYAGLQFREDQSGFLAGALAAQMTESGTIAGVYGVDIPPVIKFRNGFEQGAQYIDPDITLLGTYIPSFIDPAAGGAAATQFIGEGADVIFGAGGPTGSGGITTAAAAGVMVIGVDQDEYLSTFGNGETAGADKIISSAVKRVDQAVFQGIQALVEGGADFPGGSNLIMSASNEGVGFAPAHDAAVPEEVTARMEQILEGLKNGSIWTGVDPVSGALLPTMSEAAGTAGMFSTLMGALEATGMAETADTGGPFTVFAPTDDAFAALEAGMLDGLMADPSALTNVLLYHVVPNAVLSSDLAGMTTLTTLSGQEITVEVTDTGVVLNGSVNVVMADVMVRNGVIHVIDAVLTAPES